MVLAPFCVRGFGILFGWHGSWPVPVVGGMSQVGVVGVVGLGFLSPSLPLRWFMLPSPPVWMVLVRDLVLYPHHVLGRVAIWSSLGRDGNVTVVFCGSF